MKLLSLGVSVLGNIVGAVMAFAVLQKAALRFDWAGCKFFGWLSENSMGIYLFHQQIVYIFLSCLNGVVHPYLHAALNFLAALLLSAMLCALFRKFSLTKTLIGEK